MVGLPSLLETAFTGWRNFGAAVQEDFAKTQSLLKRTPPAFGDGAEAAKLARMVEAEIIPRLMLAHRAPEVIDAAEEDTALGGDAAEDFAHMVLAQESESLIAHVGRLLRGGLAMEDIYVDLLIPAARRLGDYWNEDRISFTDVTIGLGRMQQMVRTLSWQVPPLGDGRQGGQSALFVSCAGEQHTFGLFVIEDFFRRAGWRTWMETATEDGDAHETVAHHWFDLVGLSANRESQGDEVKATISAVRKASKNPDLFILVGGRLFEDHPELVSAVGADATASGGADALLIADKALRRLPSVM